MAASGIMLGFTPAQLVSLARGARAPLGPSPPIHVGGVLADTLVAALGAGGRSGQVRLGDGVGAAALVQVLGGAPTAGDLAVLKRAARAGVPTVVVQTRAFEGRVPYVPATYVVDVPPGHGFPLAAIAEALAHASGEEGLGLGEALPVLRPAVRRGVIRRAAVRAALVARSEGRHLPVLCLAQARLVRSLRRLDGDERRLDEPAALAAVVGPELGVTVATGLAARQLVRALPLRGGLVRAAVAAAGTLAVAQVGAALSRHGV
jgi:molybdopterin-guanine dinucleotide biosynthesis protein A